jgi:hypothetical protein
MGTVREAADPHLAAIRIVARNIKERDRVLGGQIETMRYGLFEALEDDDSSRAHDWLNSLEAALGCLEADAHPAAAPVARAIKGLWSVLVEHDVKARP